MANRPTLRDVAREAGVSIATVNRVVAGTANVREDTAEKVLHAATRVGYHARNLIERNTLAARPELRVGIVLHKEKQPFYQAFAQHLTEAAQTCPQARIRLNIVYSASQAPGEVAALLRGMKGRVDAVAATAVNHHAVTEAVADLAEAGIPCHALLSDFAQGIRKTYIGLNNLKVGRGAAKMLSVACRPPGKVALFVGGNRWHGHELRETGFRLQFRENAEGFTVLDTLVNLETRQLTYEATLELLARQPDLAGLYLAGGGMEGAIAALREEVPPGRIALVVNEHTPDSLAALADGYVTMIVGTPLQALCARLIQSMAAAQDDPEAAAPGQIFLDPVIQLPEFV